jgi:MIP family channel proteins
MSQIDMSAEGLGLSADAIKPGTFLAALVEGLTLFFFVFIGCGTIVLIGGASEPAGLVGISLVFGMMIGLLVSATAGISGGHVNPAVTLAMIITGNMKLGPGLLYIACQLIGAVLGAALLQVVLVDSIEGGLGVTTVNDATIDGTGAAVVVEAVLTFLLVFTIFAVAVDSRGPKAIAPLAIGLAVLVDHFVGVLLTGASMNPARSFGPALVTSEWDDQWVYWVGPIIGAALAALLYAGVVLRLADENETS